MRSTNAAIFCHGEVRAAERGGLVGQDALSVHTASDHRRASVCIYFLSAFNFFSDGLRTPLLMLGCLALGACQQIIPAHPADDAAGPTTQNTAALSPTARLLIRTDPAEAVRQLSRLSSPSPAVLNNLGVALDLEGKHEQAQVAYREALSAQPGLPAAMNNLALSLALDSGHSHASGSP